MGLANHSGRDGDTPRATITTVTPDWLAVERVVSRVAGYAALAATVAALLWAAQAYF